MQSRPLTGKHILITRAAQQQAATANLIKAQGGMALSFPCLEQQTLPENINSALENISAFSDIVFTSVNGVEAVCKQQTKQNWQQNKRIAAVGEQTAAALQAHGIHVDIIPSIASQQGLIDAYEQLGLPQSLLFFRAVQGSEQLIQHLQQHHIKTQLVHAYQSICPQGDASNIITMLEEQNIDAVLLGSPKTAEHYAQRIDKLGLANRPTLVVISEQVAKAADKVGLRVQLIAKQASFASMLEALADYYSQRSL